MEDFLSRTRMIVKDIDKLKNKKVLVCGIGGVGGYVVESLVRSGIGYIDLVDADSFSETNLNRQIYATLDTIGKSKVDVAKDRIKSINKDCEVNTFNIFYSKETEDEIDIEKYDYIVDAIDSVSSKLLLIENSKEFNVPIICSMGTGNKLSTNYEVADIYKTSVCPLAKVMRRELKKRNIDHLKVVYSKDEPIEIEKDENKKQVPGSICFSPAIAGFTISSEVIKDLLAQ